MTTTTFRSSARASRVSSGDARFQNEAIDIADQRAFNEVYRDASVRIASCTLPLKLAFAIRCENPQAYVDANITGFLNILECARHFGTDHLLYASSSSVYGANDVMPFSVDHNVDHPVSLYAVTKKANELMAHTYSHLFQMPTTGVRFFTVYGPWGRPDMALFHFTKSILAGQPIDVFNHGHHRRDFTYVDDIVEGVVRLLDRVPEAEPGAATTLLQLRRRRRTACTTSAVTIRSSCFDTSRYSKTRSEGRRKSGFSRCNPATWPETYADVSALARDIGYQPSTPIEVGVRRFVDWYRDFYGDYLACRLAHDDARSSCRGRATGRALRVRRTRRLLRLWLVQAHHRKSGTAGVVGNRGLVRIASDARDAPRHRPPRDYRRTFSGPFS